MDKLEDRLSYFKGKKVFLTGHTGFKGTWLSMILIWLGAEVTGYSLNPPTDPNIFEISKMGDHMNSVHGDVRLYQELYKIFSEVQPEIVLHLAAQPIVRDSYDDPLYTYETNVMGTVNLLECIRNTDSVISCVNVTTDKVYFNNEWEWGYREIEPLNGYDPYSNSKSCSELVTSSYKNAFFDQKGVAMSTARAGNVLGGGDFANHRIIPDCIRASSQGKAIIVRNPHSTRPYQHVLEPLFAYLLIALEQIEKPEKAGSYNVGPDDKDCVSTGKLVDFFCAAWGDEAKWETQFVGGPHEANFLKLDCSKIKNSLSWKPSWNVKTAIEKTVEWTKWYLAGNNVHECMLSQMKEYLSDYNSQQKAKGNKGI